MRAVIPVNSTQKEHSPFIHTNCCHKQIHNFHTPAYTMETSYSKNHQCIFGADIFLALIDKISSSLAPLNYFCITIYDA